MIGERNPEYDFRRDAECRNIGPDIFFSLNSDDIELAKQICRLCVVKEECLDYALSIKEQHGVWGGLDEKERREVHKIKRSQIA